MVKECLTYSKCDLIHDIVNQLATKMNRKGVSREAFLHPIHLTPYNQGNPPPSALVPFCFFQGDSSLLGQQRPELGNITVCDKFEPLSLEGQLFYSLNVSKHVQKQKSNSGKANGLVLLLDSDPFQLNIANKKSDGFESEGKSFKVFIHTLAQYSTFGSGSYELSSLKRMTGTESFKELPDNQKECTVLNREECQNQKFLDAVQKNRKCIPWILQTGQSKIEVRK